MYIVDIVDTWELDEALKSQIFETSTCRYARFTFQPSERSFPQDKSTQELPPSPMARNREEERLGEKRWCQV